MLTVQTMHRCVKKTWTTALAETFGLTQAVLRPASEPSEVTQSKTLC